MTTDSTAARAGLGSHAAMAAALGLLLAGCVGGGDGDDDAAVCVADWRVVPPSSPGPQVFHGTALPRELALTAGQLQALGSFGRCSGTVVAARWVLSARHCVLRAGDRFRFGADVPGGATVTATVQAVHEHAALDLALVELDADATVMRPGLTPIPWLPAGAIGADWRGRAIEAAGFGARDDGGTGERRFVAGAITAVDDDGFTLDGEGQRGLCVGDSGGPALVVADDATVRVAGALSSGAATCVDHDRFTRTDRAAAWIAALAGPPVATAPVACGGGLDRTGRCVAGGRIALHCDDDAGGAGSVVVAAPCPAATACGWDPSASGYRCVADDPCAGVDQLGRCDGAQARWCDDGQAMARDCGACAARCVVELAAGGATCVDDPCAALDERGTCSPAGDRIWCEQGERFVEPCVAQGTECRDLGGARGHQCVAP